MNRIEFYTELNSALQKQFDLVIAVEFQKDKKWETMNKSPELASEDSLYRVVYNINNKVFSILGSDVDKYYCNIIKYNNFTEVNYTESDIKITINNIRYLIINQFQKIFL